MKKILCLVLVLIMAVSLAGCGENEFTDTTAANETADKTNGKEAVISEYTADEKLSAQAEKVMVEITMKDGGVMKLELYPALAPITVANFKKLAEEGFYDGLTFHRIIEGFMIQGGDPEGTGMGGSKKTIKGEFASNGVENNISHKRGVISMARSGDPDSASSQFFICHADSEFLDGQYAAFGQLIEGSEVLDTLATTTPVLDNNGTVAAAKQPVIKTIKIVE